MRYQYIFAGSLTLVTSVMALKEQPLPLMPLVERSSNAIRYVCYNAMKIMPVCFFHNLFNDVFLTA